VFCVGGSCFGAGDFVEACFDSSGGEYVTAGGGGGCDAGGGGGGATALLLIGLGLALRGRRRQEVRS
jgi:uncharacterized protein (TIGR03382 family)